MKKERNSRKNLIDLYFYLDIASGWLDINDLSEKQVSRYLKTRDSFDKRFSDRSVGVDECDEYYGLFKLENERYGVDPKRMKKKLSEFISDDYKKMNQRNTTYFHPLKKQYYDYKVNIFCSKIDEIKRDFIDVQKPIIDKSLKNIKNEYKEVTPGDCYNFQCGIYEADEAQMLATKRNMEQYYEIKGRWIELYTNLYNQFFHSMAARIEAVSVSVYSKLNPQMKRWSRDKLYDNINLKGLSSRDLTAFKYHDKLYLIWNFIKHNNVDIYENLKRDYPDVLIPKKYKSGDLAKYYLNIDDKLIIDLLDGVKHYFIQWCKLNCDEDYEEAQWNYDKFFVKKVHDEIKYIKNPLALEF